MRVPCRCVPPRARAWHSTHRIPPTPTPVAESLVLPPPVTQSGSLGGGRKRLLAGSPPPLQVEGEQETWGGRGGRGHLTPRGDWQPVQPIQILR